jgi:hypothetical protein
VRRIPTEVHSLALDALGEPILRLRTPLNWRIDPGQAALADLGESCGLLTPLFPCETAPGLVSFPIFADSALRPGMRLSLTGPIGTGFRPPAGSRHWLLASTERLPARLLPLLVQGVERGVEVVFAGELSTHSLPPSVEVERSLDRALDWADYLAVDTTPEALPQLLDSLTAAGVAPQSLAAEILVASDMLCGFGGCGACAVRSRRGWVLACADGPVRPLHTLLGRDPSHGT